LSTADEVLVQTPLDPAASVLKARALFGLGREDDAVAFLNQHLQAIPSDTGALTLLAQIYERRDDWSNVTAVRQRLEQAKPGDKDNLVTLVRASLRTGNISLARSASFRLLRPEAPVSLVSEVLDLWTSYWPSSQRIDDARKLATVAPKEQRLVYAAFLSRLGSPADAIRLTSNDARLPVNAATAEPNAVLGDALLRTGNLAAAERRLDSVIAFDPGNATALRARAELELRTGKAKVAVEDAQKLVTVVPRSAPDRLLLARAYDAAGNTAWANRTLWTAFRDIPANDSIYGALRSRKNGNPDELADLQAEFDRQRDGQVRKGLL
jgi:predicted Zn-dependent protease